MKTTLTIDELILCMPEGEKWGISYHPQALQPNRKYRAFLHPIECHGETPHQALTKLVNEIKGPITKDFIKETQEN